MARPTRNLEIARAIADAVVAAGPRRDVRDWRDPPTQAVIEVLWRHHLAFLVYDVDPESGALLSESARVVE